MRPSTVMMLMLLGSGCASAGRPVPQPFPSAGAPDAAPHAAASDRDPAGASVVETALMLRGTPYQDGGADRAGFDCSGLVSYVFGRHGLALPRSVTALLRVGDPVARRDLGPGDLVFFRTVARKPSHVGIALGTDRFIHAPSSGGYVRVERLDGPYWTRRYVGARRVIDGNGL